LIDCNGDEIYNCPAKDIKADSLGHCLQAVCLQKESGVAHCPGRFF